MIAMMDEAREQATTASAAPASGDGRERVLNEAYALFAALGYAEVSMQQIAAAVGVSKATLYHHFAGKDELFGAVCRRELQRIHAGVAERIDPRATFRAQLEQVARFFLDHALQADHIRLMTDLERHLPPEQRHRCLCGEDRPDALVRSLFERAAATGELRAIDLDVAVPMFFGMVMGQVTFAHLHPDVYSVRSQGHGLAAAIADVLLRGIGADRAGRREE